MCDHTEDTELETCDDCGQSVAFDGLSDTEDGKVCDSCMCDYVELDCGDVIHIENAALCSYSGNWYREGDTTQCDDCGETVHDDHIHSVNGGGSSVCQSCVENGDYCEPADDCYNLYHVDRLYWSDRHEEYFLEPPSCGSLLSYDSNVFDHCNARKYVNGEPVHGGRCGTDLLFGVELECDSDGHSSPDDIAHALECSGFDTAYGICKEDSTVDGLELVTLPADLQSHKTRYDWDSWCRAMREHGTGYGANDAGMHVHINRQAVSALTLGKMLVFTNATENAEFLSTIAQRDITMCGWCEQAPNKFDKVGKAAADPSNGKYSILNVTPYTIENRMFNSNLRPERVRKNIEFCHALVRFCETISARQITVKNFQEFVSAERKEYPNLHAFIAERASIADPFARMAA